MGGSEWIPEGLCPLSELKFTASAADRRRCQRPPPPPPSPPERVGPGANHELREHLGHAELFPGPRDGIGINITVPSQSLDGWNTGAAYRSRWPEGEASRVQRLLGGGVFQIS